MQESWWVGGGAFEIPRGASGWERRGAGSWWGNAMVEQCAGRPPLPPGRPAGRPYAEGCISRRVGRPALHLPRFLTAVRNDSEGRELSVELCEGLKMRGPPHARPPAYAGAGSSTELRVSGPAPGRRGSRDDEGGREPDGASCGCRWFGWGGG